ncbi:sigma-70 family RNA polymerase sigma factor [Corynebacterium renale]|uniref:sigma-70 family RNA polymerase sigma factor n=1 Tax=Corynebacterium renale TaxID=1724 RepID=UPI00216393A7|nr:sigma-70 family RNA polymerase sigma factor [Corynebacterium renale]
MGHTSPWGRREKENYVQGELGVMHGGDIYASATDEFLTRHHLAGDSRAFREIVRRHERAVRWVARRYARTEADIDDIVQDTFLKAAQKMDTFRGTAKLSTWLHRICMNVGADFMRHRFRREVPTDSADLSTFYAQLAWDPLDSWDTALWVRAALRHISAQQVVALVIIDAFGYSVKHVAAREGVAVGTIKSRRARGRDCLRMVLHA